MKRKLFILLFFPFVGFSQVGINQENPQQTVHVGGANSSVKVEGLNMVNNPDNLGAGSVTRVFVDAEGDLVLGTTEDNIIFILDDENYIPDANDKKVVQTGTGDNFTKIEVNNYTFPSVIMADDGIMEINYSISWYIRRNNSEKVADGAGRTVRTIVYIYDVGAGTFLTDENGVEKTFGITGQFYSNNNERMGAHGFFYNTGSDYVQVPAGEYRLIFGGLVGAYPDTDNTYVWFGGEKDQVQVIAHY
ncbi:MAG TPA: hypothetical protein VFM70_01925 [Salinimicrobium sp.]|nr:hypothetical protein [Salinimicrobium sp.]